MTYDLLVVGGAGMDTIIPVEALPVPPADAVMVGPIHTYVAHTGTGVALGCRTLGLRVKFVDYLGADDFGQRVVERFEAEGLDFSWLESPAGTRRAVNFVARDGRRMSFYDARDVPGQTMPTDFYEPWLAESRHVHLSIVDYARHMIPVVRRSGATISTDLHAWDGVREYQKDFAYAADVVFLSAAELGERRDAVLVDILAAGRAELAVATDGAAGAYLALRGREIQHFPAVTPADPIVDSNGAGDAFVSGFLSGWLAGLAPEICMTRGLRAGAFACTVHGTAERFATPSDLEG